MSHTCHALLCKKPCPPRMLMCRGCWALVSGDTQREVYRTVKLRGRERVIDKYYDKQAQIGGT